MMALAMGCEYCFALPRRQLYQLLFRNSQLCLAGLYIEGAFGQRTRLVEYHRVDLGDGIEVVATFEEDTQAGVAPIPPK